MMMGMEDLRRRVLPVQRPEGTGDELWGQWVQDISFLQLQGLQLCLDLLKGDAMQACIFMADGDKALPKFSRKGQKNRMLRDIELPLTGIVPNLEWVCHRSFYLIFPPTKSITFKNK